jgi:hypothetical protein
MNSACRVFGRELNKHGWFRPYLVPMIVEAVTAVTEDTVLPNVSRCEVVNGFANISHERRSELSILAITFDVG